MVLQDGDRVVCLCRFCRVPQKIIDILTYGGGDEMMAAEQGDSDEDVIELAKDKEGVGSVEDDGPDFVKVQLDEPLFDVGETISDVWDFDDHSSSGKGKKKEREPEPLTFEEEEDSEDIFADLLCARCYSLKHYGRVKSDAAEASMPEFDFGKSVGVSISGRQFRRSIVLAVVDLADFDGSLPRQAISSLLQQPEIPNSKLESPQNFRLVIAANKADLLPKDATRVRLERWVRKRVSEGGLPKPSAVHIVSSHTKMGVKSLLVDIQNSIGTRGDVWVVGAQNAGKSSLINAMRTSAGLLPSTITAAPLPGTTLGIVDVPGLVPKGCRMLDTPGVRHEYQLTSLLLPDEVKMVLPRRHLKPRTYRIGSGNTISIGGIARIDVCETPGATVYLTLWASDDISSHMGKTERADQNYETHVGTKMVPPLVNDETSNRMDYFPALLPTDVQVKGVGWSESSVDICIAGVGWLGVGANGTASFKVWAPPGISITTRTALIPDMAKEFCRPGFDTILPDRTGKKKKGKKGRK